MKPPSDRKGSSDPQDSLEAETYLDSLQTSGKRHGPSLDARVSSLQVVANGGSEPEFEIIAVPGLGADPYFTWTKTVEVPPLGPHERRDAARSKARENAEAKEVHLLLLLKETFPMARILCYIDDSAWFRRPIVKTTQEIGVRLEEEIKAKRLSSVMGRTTCLQKMTNTYLGGITIKEALCADLSRSIINNTVGIIFLGTPHQGARLVKSAALLAPVPKFYGIVDDTLIKCLTEHNCALSNLADRFDKLRSRVEETHRKIRIIAFYETKPVHGSSKPLVSRDSALVHADAFERWPVNTDHSNLNKCSGIQDSYFVNLTNAIARLRCPSRLQLADSMIHNQHYTDKLKITRLSGDTVDLSHCYINLAIEQQSAGPKKQNIAGSPFLLPAREEVDDLDKSRELDLKTIFSQRMGFEGAPILPRRIMIRGRAGVGKSTLCKKMVHDFVHGGTWRELFHRILWIPLRNLAHTGRMMKSGYGLMNLFKDEFFPEHHELAEELARDWSSKRDKTLFVLDGLDEISQVLENEQSGMKNFIERLLKQPNLIVTSRCHVSHPAVENVDLKAEVLGFHPDQVIAYLEADSKMCSRIDDFDSWLNDRWILHYLVRTPILLDALCLVWDSPRRKTINNTITGIYIAITQELRSKDIKKLHWSSSASLSEDEIKSKYRSVETILEHLAFSGLPRNLEEFTTDHRNKLAGRFRPPSDLSLDETLGRISFMRSSDGPEHTDRGYHFLHRTFQEFFAAQYFVRQWTCSSELEYILDAGEPNEEHRPTDPAKFLERYKYAAQYDVFWRFVTGLIAAEHDSHLGRFFAALEQEPFDLLGPTHQLLIMHCLAEVDAKAKLPVRSNLELRLSEWAQFESERRRVPVLAEEPEFPEQSLYMALDTVFKLGSCDGTQAILSQVCANSRRQLSEPVELLIFKSLKKFGIHTEGGIAEPCCHLAVSVLSSRVSLSMSTAREMKALLEDTQESGTLRIDTARILRNHPNLVKAMLLDLKVWLKSEDQVLTIAAATALSSLENVSAETEEILVALLGSNDEAVRGWASRALYQRHEISEMTQSSLLQMVKAPPNQEIRQLAATVLSRTGHLRDTILMELVEALPDVIDTSKIQGLQPFCCILNRELPGPTQDTLVERFQCAPQLRSVIAGLLGVHETLSEKASTTLRRVISDKSDDDDHRLYAIDALRGIKDQSWPTIIALTKVVTDDSQNSRCRLPASLILHWRPSSPATTETLFRLLENEDNHDGVRYYALDALLRREPDLVTTARLFTLLQDNMRQTPTTVLAARFLQVRTKLEPSQEEALAHIINDAVIDDDQRSWRDGLAWLHRTREGYLAAVLAKQLQLSETVQDSLLRRLRNLEHHWTVRYLAATALGSQVSLARAALLLKNLDKRDLDEVCEIASVMALAPAFVDVMLNLIGSHADAEQQTKTAAPASGQVKLITGLYEGLLDRSFMEQVTLCVYDNVCVIDQPQGRHRVPLDDVDLDSLRSHIAGRQQLINEKKYKLWCRMAEEQ